jgi:hypothetical protein
MNEPVSPKLLRQAFTCPHCNAHAQQKWQDTVFDDVKIAWCMNCSKRTVWVLQELVYPRPLPAPLPNPDLPDDIQKDYQEARAISAESPRGAAALLRLCIQKLCQRLGEPGKDLNKDIGSLVKKGLLPQVQKMLDSVRVIGNNAVHPGEIDLNDTPEVAATLFRLVNAITEQMITHPREVQELYETLPTGAVEAIERRDKPG